MARIFVLEGADATGKSTLAKFLTTWLMRAYHFHSDGNPPLFRAMSEFQKCTLDNAEWNVKHNFVHTVFDRHWPSEYVYGAIFRPDTIEQFRWLEFKSRMRDIGVTYVFCRGPGQFERHQKNQDPAHPYNAVDYERVVMGYENLFSGDLMQNEEVVFYDMDEHGSDLRAFCDEHFSV